MTLDLGGGVDPKRLSGDEGRYRHGKFWRGVTELHLPDFVRTRWSSPSNDALLESIKSKVTLASSFLESTIH